MSVSPIHPPAGGGGGGGVGVGGGIMRAMITGSVGTLEVGLEEPGICVLLR